VNLVALSRPAGQGIFFGFFATFRGTILVAVRTICMDARQLKKENGRFKKDNDRLRKELEKARAVQAEYKKAVEEKAAKIDSLERRIIDLIRQLRGSRQEIINPDQLMLFSAEELQELVDELEQRRRQAEQETEKPKGSDADSSNEADPPKPKKGGGRRSLPKNIPTVVERHELKPEDQACPCCGETRSEIGVETSEQLDFVPGYWKRIIHERVKYACKTCQENVELAPKPPQPIEKGIPGPGLAAHTTLSKFGDHTPLYRQEDIHSRLGWTIRRSTLCGWLFDLAELSKPLVMRMKYLMLQSKVIHTDDTKIKMLQPGLGICKEAKFWPYLGDWLHSSEERLAIRVYLYAESMGRIVSLHTAWLFIDGQQHSGTTL